jgi:MFS family permease
LLVVAATNTYVRLRPDPLIAAGGVDPDARGFKLPPVSEALRVIRTSPMAKLALSAMVIAQASMVGVMTMTPLHMRDHGHSDSLSGAVIALHVVGMFGLAPIVGRFSDRGRLPVILRGSLMLVGATLISALAGYRTPMLFAGLFFLGLGWSGCMIAGSSLLVDSVPSEHRLKVQGSADLLMSLCGGIAGFGSGFVKRQWGYHVLSQMGMAATAFLFVLAVRQFRRNAAATAPVGAVS